MAKAKRKLVPLPMHPTYEYLVLYGDEEPTMVSAESDRHAWAIVNTENQRSAAPNLGRVLPLSEKAAEAMRSVVTARHGVKCLKERQKRPGLRNPITDKDIKEAEKKADKALAEAKALVAEGEALMPQAKTLRVGKLADRDPVQMES